MAHFPKPPAVQLPTVGRNVHFFVPGYPEPMAAIVAAVEHGYTINLGVFNYDGSVHNRQLVPHASDAPVGRPYWDWMDYQKGQAAKTEALQAELDAKSREAFGEIEKLKTDPAPAVSTAVVDEKR